MGKELKESKRKRRGFRGAAAVLLALCISVSGLPVSGYAGAGAGMAGRNPGAYTDTGNPGDGLPGESQEIVRGFGSKIKDKKQKEIKVKVNHGNPGNQNGKSWNLQMIQAGETGSPEDSGRKIKIAVIDSGINFSTDLPVAVRKNFIPEDEPNILYEDPSGHGTAVAGIIAALDNDEGITGINPRVELYSARVLDGNLEAPAGRIAEAIDWAVEQDVDIINMSFGIAKNVKELEEAVGRAAEAGILLVAAAGNGETAAYPAAYDEVIAVGSVTAEGLAAEGSAGGEALELMAPGENILSSGIFGGVTGMSGTSMAAPHVAGAASVLMERNPEMPADYIRMLLNYSANLYGSPDEYGNGVLDLGYAVEINDKFKKLYEKHIDKAEKNKKKKENQKEKFWGEVLKIIPENEKAVETFTGVEVVEGMWLKDHQDYGGKLHEDFVITGVEGSQVISFTGEQMKILKYACGYPDATKGGLNAEGKPYHGHLWQYKIYPVNGEKQYVPVAEANYVANYILLTRIADVFGSVPSFAGNYTQLVKNALEILFQEAEAYMYADDLAHMRRDFGSVTKLGERTWQQVFGDMGGTVSVTPQNVKFFIYGMALHSITDTFAHSTFSKKGAQWGRVGHNRNFAISCDNDAYIPERWAAAQYAADSVLTKLGCGLKGDLLDFVSPSSFQYGTFYLGNLSAYAQMTDAVQYPWAKGLLKRGDLWFNVQDETKIKYDGKFENGSVSHKTRPVLKASEY